MSAAPQPAGMPQGQYTALEDAANLWGLPECLAACPPFVELRCLMHRLSAGFPSPAEDHAEDGLDLNDYLVRNRAATFLFTVKGDSMIQAGIEEGDKVVVDRSVQARHRDIVVAVLEGQYTLKRLICKPGLVALQPENPAYRPVVVGEETPWSIWGVVVGLVRRYPVRG